MRQVNIVGRQSVKRKMWRYLCVYIVAFFCSLFLAVGLLVASSFLPQKPIDENVLISAQQMIDEDQFVADHSYGSMMSRSSEALMFMESKAMNKEDLSAIFSNPRYVFDDNYDARENLYHYSLGEQEQTIVPYSRYWMGFRVTLRLLLQKLDFYQIRRYTATAFFVLLFSVICSIAQNIDSKVAFIFACSVVLVRPHVIAISLQSFTCFAIALSAMLIAPWIWKHSDFEGLYFMELGIVTMYFDFYTFPPLTLGLPMVYLYMLEWKNGKVYSTKRIFQNVFVWLCSYSCMWVAKLLLADIFTDENSIQIGVNQMKYWTQLDNMGGYNGEYNPINALYYVVLSLISDADGKHIFLGGVVVMVFVFFARLLYYKPAMNKFIRHMGLVLILCIPLIWFSVAAKPTVVHHYFQYRSISMSFFAGLCYLYICTEKV